MDDGRIPMKNYISQPQQNGRVGRQNTRCEKNLIEGIRILKFNNWRSKAHDRDVRRKLIKTARA